MNIPFLHPGLRALEDFAYGGGEETGRAATAVHLQRCASCRRSVSLIRELSRPLEADRDAPDAALLERVLASRKAGERVVLPVAVPERVRRRIAPQVAAAVLVAAAIAAIALTNTRDAAAGAWAGVLRFEPETPRSRSTVDVVYRPSEPLAGESVLRLRARLRKPGDPWYGGVPITAVAALRREANGTYTGSFTLPDSVVYAAFAVEDTVAGRVDDNDGHGWELLVHADDGRPLLPALEQRVADLMGRSWEEAYATVLRMAEVYPEDFTTWDLRETFDRWLHPNSADSVTAVYRRTLDGLTESLRTRQDVPVPILERLTYRTFTGDTAGHGYWRARLQQADPRNQQLQQLRTVELSRAHRGDPVRLVAALDALWDEIGPAWGSGRLMVLSALNAAQRIGDPDAIRRWAERLRHVETEPGDPTIRPLLNHSSLRREGMARLRAELARAADAPESERGLYETAFRQRARVDGVRRRLLADLGAALLAEGELRPGLDTLSIAVEKGWNRAMFQQVGDARLAAGDTTGALRMYALVAADPRTPAALADSLAARSGVTGQVAAWESLVQAARRELPVRVLEGADPVPLRRRARLADREGGTHDLAALARGSVTLVVFWSRNCGPAIEELPLVNSIAAQLARKGVNVVSIADEAPAEGVDRFLREKGVTMPVFYDTRGEARDALGSFGTPAYYMLDNAGRIRFRYANPVDDLLVQAEALSLE